MTANVATTYEGLNMEYKTLVDDFIKMLSRRQKNEEETLKVIQDARNGIGLSEAFDNVDDFMEALNAEDQIYCQVQKGSKESKKRQNSGYDENVFKEQITKLANREPLDKEYDDHALHGKFEGSREFHLGFDLAVIYEIREGVLQLQVMRIGTHDEVF